MSERNVCWCGKENFLDYSPTYKRCDACGTLIVRNWPEEDITNVQDTGELYSQNYYLTHLPQDYGFPSLEERTRADLSERVLFWTETLLRYKLPPARVLELGSAHGGFIAMLRLAGFDATGLELSPWLVQYAKKTFDIPMYQGPLEDQHIPLGSLDAIVLMDVLEHLPDPVGTMRCAVDLLSPDGILLVQTPRFPEEKQFEELKETQDPFLTHFKEKEHLFLFSPRSAQQLFSQLGCPTIIFEPAIYEHYDMYFVVGKTTLTQKTSDDISQALQTSPHGRLVQAMLDLSLQKILQKNELADKLALSEADREARLQVILKQGKEYSRLEAMYSKLQSTLSNAILLLRTIRTTRMYRLIRGLGRWAWVDERIQQIIDQSHSQMNREVGDFLPKTDTATVSLSSYKLSINELNASRSNVNLLNAIREYNHQMLDTFNQFSSLTGKTILDVGASPHGYTLEQALQRGASLYVGVTLSTEEPVYVQGNSGENGIILKMDATDLRFPDKFFDRVFSISAFEHILEIEMALDEIKRVLKIGGLAFISFEPIWSSSGGHHLHHFGEWSKVVPPWSHLIWTPDDMRQKLSGKWPKNASITLDKAIEWVYFGDNLNRKTIRDFKRVFESSGLEIESFTELKEKNTDIAFAERVSMKTGFTLQELETKGISILLKKTDNND